MKFKGQPGVLKLPHTLGSRRGPTNWCFTQPYPGFYQNKFLEEKYLYLCQETKIPFPESFYYAAVSDTSIPLQISRDERIISMFSL